MNKISTIFLCAIFAVVLSTISMAQNRAVSLHLTSTDYTQIGDIITKSIYVPEGFTPNYTYYSGMGWWGTNGEGDGYCGIQQHPSGRNFIFSLWDPEATNEPIKAVYLGEGTKSENFGGEGTGLKSWNFELGWNTNTWYRLMTRIWDYNQHTYFGYWVQNTDTKQWYHLVTMDYPVANVRINTGINSFLEDWYGNGWETRRYHIKDGFKRKPDSTWQAFNRCKFSVNQEGATANYNNNYDGGVENDYYYMQSGGNTKPSCGTVKIFELQEETYPQWDTIDVINASAKVDITNQLLEINWEINNTRGPQFSYNISVYDNAELTGSPTAIVSDTIPQQRKESINIASITDGTYYAVLTTTDILDQKGLPYILKITIDREKTEPKSQFSIYNPNIYCYSMVDFNELSTGNPDSWEWSFEGGYPSTSDQRNPQVFYGDTGSYDVQLIVKNNKGIDTLLISNYIKVEFSDDNALNLTKAAIDYAEISPLNLENPNEFTFECWIKTEKYQQENAAIFYCESTKDYGIVFKPGNELGYIWADKYQTWHSGLFLPLNTWNHIAITVTGDSATLYLNGVPSTNKKAHTPFSFSEKCILGAISTDEYNFNGLLDEIKIWNKVLTHTEILDNRFKEVQIDTENSLVAYYKCNQQNTIGLYDFKREHLENTQNIAKASWGKSFPKVNNPAAPVANIGFLIKETGINQDIKVFDASANVPTQWRWTFTGANSTASTERFPTISYSKPGKYNIALWVKNNQGVDSVAINDAITILAPPAPVALFAANNTSIKEGESIEFINLSKNSPTNYKWQFEGGTPGESTLENPVVSYQKAGKYDVQLIASHEYGADTLLIEECIEVKSLSSVETKLTNAQIIYNNNCPYVQLQNTGQVSAKVYNILGKQVHQAILNEGDNQLNISVPTGIYFLKMNLDGNWKTLKFYLTNNSNTNF